MTSPQSSSVVPPRGSADLELFGGFFHLGGEKALEI